MTNVFSNDLKQQTNKNYTLFRNFSIIVSIVFGLLMLTLVLFHKSINKISFIAFSTVAFTLYIVIIYYCLRTTIYYNKLNKLINTTLNHDKITGQIKKLDSYDITVNGLLYKQYEIKHEITQVIYVLYGIDISEINNKLVTIYIVNNVMYAYEVHDE